MTVSGYHLGTDVGGANIRRKSGEAKARKPIRMTWREGGDTETQNLEQDLADFVLASRTLIVSITKHIPRNPQTGEDNS